MSSCCNIGSRKYAAYDTKGVKGCVSAPCCSVHKHRPRPPPCPRPDDCYKKCIHKKKKCPSAMEVVSRAGSRCTCSQLQSRSTRHARRAGRCKSKCQRQRHRTRIRKAYNRRSMVSRWTQQRRNCCKCSPCCQGSSERCCRCTIL